MNLIMDGKDKKALYEIKHKYGVRYKLRHKNKRHKWIMNKLCVKYNI